MALLKFKKYIPLILVAFLFSCKMKNGGFIVNKNGGAAIGTFYQITYLSESELDYQVQIDSVFEVVNKSMSTYLEDSDISKINKGDSTLVVDAMFQDVFNQSREVYKRTNGYFDPTVGVLVNAWGFGPGNQIKLDSTRVDSLLSYVGFDKVTLTKNNTIKKEHPSIYFDFNAVGKGYNIDRLGVMLDQKGIENYLIEVGGEVLAKGKNLVSKKPWTIGVDDPEMGEERELKLVLAMENKAMASSGNYRHFRTDSITGEKYVHIINPITGFTKNSNVLGATVIAVTCAEADAFATAFMAMDLDDSIKLLTQQKELDAYIIYLDDNGDTKEFMTDGFKNLILE